MKKNIYIKDEDVSLFEKAEELGGDSISSVIAEALRRYVEIKEAEAQGMEEHILTVGSTTSIDDDTRKVKFVGRLLARGTTYNGQTSDRKDRGTTWKIYITKAGKIVVYADDWTCWQGEACRSAHVVLAKIPGYKDSLNLDCFYESVTVPGSILEEAHAAIGQELVEYIE